MTQENINELQEISKIDELDKQKIIEQEKRKTKMVAISALTHMRLKKYLVDKNETITEFVSRALDAYLTAEDKKTDFDVIIEDAPVLKI